MNPRARVSMLTGAAFPLGAMLGVLFAALTSPRASTGSGDIAYAMLWFVVGGAPLAMVVFWRTARRVEWKLGAFRLAVLRVANGVFIATGTLICAIWFFGRSGNGAFLFLALPVCSTIVSWQAARVMATAGEGTRE